MRYAVLVSLLLLGCFVQSPPVDAGTHCPFSIECPYDGLSAYYRGISFPNGRCICHYDHDAYPTRHYVDMACL